MKIPQQARSRGLQFNITPLIDIVFLLVIFFLVATHFASSEIREPIDLPETSETDERPQPPRRLTINVLADGTYHVQGSAVTLKQIERMLAESADVGAEHFEVEIRGDRTVPYRKIEPLLLACARAGIERVGFTKRDRHE